MTSIIYKKEKGKEQKIKAMNCTEHSTCDHGRVKCDCAKCWKQEHQCEYTYNAETTTDEFGDEHDSTVGTSGTKRGMANDKKRKRNENLYCTETLRDSAATSTWKTPHNETTDIRREEYSPKSTQLSIRSGTSSPIGFHFPNPGSREWSKYIRGIDEYQQSEDKKRFIEHYIRSAQRELQTNQNMDRNRKRERCRDESTNNDDRRGNKRDKRSTSKYTRSNSELRTDVENKKKIHNSGTQRRKSRNSSSTAVERGTPSIFEFSDNEIEKFIEESNDNGGNSNNQCEEETETRSDRRGTLSPQRGRRSTSSSEQRYGGRDATEKKYK